MIHESKEDLSEQVRYAARQPILTANQRVVGYKLLFRTLGRQTSCGDPSECLGRTAIDVSSLLGLNTLCDNRLAFIGCARATLVEKRITLLPAEKAVAEIPDSVVPDPDLLEACSQLKDAGYRIALDNFHLDDARQPFVEFADFIKVNLKRTCKEDLARLAVVHRAERRRMLADNVEAWEDFQLAREAGFQYFQGYFFRKPENVRTQRVALNRAIGLRVIQVVSRPELDWREIEETIKGDVTLYYRLLRYLNSAAFGLRSEVRSVRQALTILGEEEVRRWCRLAVLVDVALGRPSDLVLSALIRARFGELIGQKVEHGDSDLFLVGLLSLMDAVLEMPMGMVLDGLPLDGETRTLLLEHEGRLAPIFDLMLATEAGAWGAVVRLCERLGLDEEFVAESSLSAMKWAQSIAATNG